MVRNTRSNPAATVHAHADREDQARDARQRQGRADPRPEAEEHSQVTCYPSSGDGFDRSLHVSQEVVSYGLRYSAHDR
jgi:hypothetical protein